MKKENLYEAIGEIDDNYINDAHQPAKKRTRAVWFKWTAMAACLCLMLVAFPMIQNFSSDTQEADTIELSEVLEWSAERVEKKLIGEYRGNILHSWGEPDIVLTETSDKYYLDEDNSKYIILYYDNEGYITEFAFGNDLTETTGFDFVIGEPHVWAKEIISIVDRTVDEDIETADAEELFYSDDEYIYMFPSIKSQFVLVTFADGTVKTVAEALEDGEITIADLDNFEINYIKKTK